jgi:MFS family permease
MSVSPITAQAPILEPAPPTERATRVRYSVLAWACSLSLLTYLDRACIKEVEGDMGRDLGLDDREMSLAFSAFFLAYSLFEVPSGWLGDRIGPRKVLFRIVVWWSIFTALTGVVTAFRHETGWAIPWFTGPIPIVFTSFGLLLLIRFLFGVGEAGAYPNASKVLRNWFPYERRGMTQGLLWAFARWGGSLAPALVVVTSLPFGWRGTFYAFGVLGGIWALFFWFNLRDSPRQHPRVNDAELRFIEAGQVGASGARLPISWASMLRSPTLWALSLMYFFSNAGWCFFITWDKKYYSTELELSGFWLTIATTGPLFCGGIACLLGGVTTDLLVRVFGRRWGRSAQGLISYICGGTFFLMALFVRHPFLSVVFLCAASFSKDMAMGVSWATCCDIGHRYSGSVSGFMNMVGNMGSVVMTPVVAYLAKAQGGTGGWSVALVASAISLFCAAAGWLIIDPRRVVVYAPDDHRQLVSDGVLR